MAGALGKRERGIEEPVILLRPSPVSNLAGLSQDLDCGELVKLAAEPQISAPLGLPLSDVGDSQHLDETLHGFDDGAA